MAITIDLRLIACALQMIDCSVQFEQMLRSSVEVNWQLNWDMKSQQCAICKIKRYILCFQIDPGSVKNTSVQ